MSVWTTLGGAVILVVVVVLMLRRKLRRDAIFQDGREMGSAMLAEAVMPSSRQVRFVIVRGAAGFREDQVFEHQGTLFQIESFARTDDSSTVLRRFIDVTCRVAGRGPA